MISDKKSGYYGSKINFRLDYSMQNICDNVYK